MTTNPEWYNATNMKAIVSATGAGLLRAKQALFWAEGDVEKAKQRIWSGSDEKSHTPDLFVYTSFTPTSI